MEKVTKLNKESKTSFAKNVVMLMVAQIVIKVLGLIYKLVIVNADGFGDVGNGYYSIGYQIYAVLLTISSSGIPLVISKLVSEKVAVGDTKGAHRIFKVSLKLFSSVGLIMSLGLFFGADIIATKFLNVPNVKYVLLVLAPAIVLVSVSSVLRGYFSGLGSFKCSSVSQVLEQVFNCVLSITFVYSLVGKDPSIMAMGGNLSTTLAIIISLSYLVLYYRIRRKDIYIGIKNSEYISKDTESKGVIRTILAISIPMTIGSIISVVAGTIDTFTISNCIQTAYKGIIIEKEALETKAMELAGVLSKVETLIHLPLAINLAFYSALIPSISGLIKKDNKKVAALRLSFVFFASTLILLPCAVGFIVLSEPILKMIYPQASQGAVILQLSTVTMLLIGLSNIVNAGLYGIGNVYVPAVSIGIGSVIKLVLNIVLISNPKINIYGAVISSIICQIIAFVISFSAIQKNMKLEIKFMKNILKPILISGMMGLGVYISYRVLSDFASNTIATVISILIGMAIYLIMSLFVKVLSKEEIFMLPFGEKMYGTLKKMRLYK